MKKILALILALVMVLSMSAFAFAEDSLIDNNNPEASGDITVKVNGYSEIIHYVTINWSDMLFEYDFEAWNEEAHEYTGAWKDEAAEIEVSNHSNIAIKASADVQDKVSDDGITVVLDGADSYDLGIDETQTFKLKPSDDSVPNTKEGYKNKDLVVASVVITIQDIPRQ